MIDLIILYKCKILNAKFIKMDKINEKHKAYNFTVVYFQNGVVRE